MRLFSEAPAQRGLFSCGFLTLPACDHCGAAQPTFWQSVEPPQVEEVDLPELQDHNWDLLSPQEQEQRLNDELDHALPG